MTHDFLRLLESPQCPVASIVVGLLVRKCAAELSYHCNVVSRHSVPEEEGNAGVCKNINYATFLLDLTGILATNICQLCSSTRIEQRHSELTSLPADTINALKVMYRIADQNSDASECTPDNSSATFLHEVTEKVKSRSLEQIAESESTVVQNNIPKKKKRKKTQCEKITGGAEGAYAINIVSPDEDQGGANSVFAEPASVLSLLVDVTSAGLDIMTQRLPAEEGVTADLVCFTDKKPRQNVARSTSLPPVWNILSQCGVPTDVLR
jgi:hypothetical protein